VSRNARGQATVELALVLPFVVVLMLAVLQAGLVARDDIRLTHAARAAARAAATGADDDLVFRSAAEASGLDGSRLVAAVTRTGDLVTVEVTYRAPTDVVLVGALVKPITLHEKLTLAIEPGVNR
jgi:uncharacterized protein (UPF0333 family)